MRTFQTRVFLTDHKNSLLGEYAELYNRVKRSLFADMQKGTSTLLQLKKQYLVRFQITARQFNSCRMEVEGQIRSQKELQKRHIVFTQEKVSKLEKKLSSKRKLKNRHLLHQKLQRYQNGYAKLLQDKDQNRVQICFGSRKLFKSQYQLPENGFLSHKEWKRDWKKARCSTFFQVGSKDETAGNQSCVATNDEKGSLTLRLRLPDKLNAGKYLLIENVYFAYGQKEITQALQENALRNKYKKEKKSDYTKRGLAISYRFIFDEEGLRVFASVEEKQPAYITSQKRGYIGVDLNVDHIAVAETNHNGNLVNIRKYALNLYGKNQKQAKALIGDVVKELVGYAQSKKKPIIIEKLDFTAKKNALKNSNPKYARMLSSFAYTKTLEAIKARSYRFGVQIFEVNPAYTSLLGKIKFAKRYGLSVHHAAAFCIARRIAGFSETLPSHSDVPDGKGSYIAFSLPERTEKRFYWRYLGKVAKKLRMAHAEHFRVRNTQSVGILVPT